MHPSPEPQLPPASPVHGARRRRWIGSAVLVAGVIAGGGGLAAWKRHDLVTEQAASEAQPEAVESLELATAREREHRVATTAIGTVRALRSVTLQNELAGTVREVALEPGATVEAGALLVALDVSVEEAELAAQEARADLAATLLERMQRALAKSGASEADVDRAQAELDVATAEVARTRAIIEKKTIRAPFRARVGLADVHPGQYLDAGSFLTTLQGLDETAHVDFSVTQEVAGGLREGDRLEIAASESAAPLWGTIVALDARIDPGTRNARVRALVDAAAAPAPGASVRVSVPVGATQSVVTVPVSALRKGPAGDHVFVVAADDGEHLRAHLRMVESGAVLGDEVVIESGLAAGEQVAASGSFKLREGVLVSAVPTVTEATAAR
jgi:membrane fusion protein (multidrug efflux system)